MVFKKKKGTPPPPIWYLRIWRPGSRSSHNKTKFNATREHTSRRCSSQIRNTTHVKGYHTHHGNGRNSRRRRDLGQIWLPRRRHAHAPNAQNVGSRQHWPIYNSSASTGLHECYPRYIGIAFSLCSLEWLIRACATLCMLYWASGRPLIANEEQCLIQKS